MSAVTIIPQEDKVVLLQLLANNGGGRKRRSTRLCSYHEESNQLQEGRLAVHLVFQGFLNSLSEGRIIGKLSNLLTTIEKYKIFRRSLLQTKISL